MKRQITIGALITFGFIAVLAFIKYLQISSAIAEHSNMGPPPQAVTSFVAREEVWPRTLAAVGSLAAVEGAMLSAEDGGRVIEINFESSAKVEKGTILLSLDSDVEAAQLDGARAELALAEITAKRQRALRKRGANAQSDLDSAEASLRNLAAEVKRLEAVVARKQIIAPFSGRTGIRMVNVGQTLSAGASVVELTSVDPLYVNFTLPQQALAELEIGSRVDVRVDSFPDSDFQAQLTAIEATVDRLTRNIGLQATLQNPEGKLRAGMFVAVEVYLPAKDSFIAIPASSVSYAPYGNSVFVIGKGEQGAPQPATSTVVTLGPRRGDRIAVLSGLKAGDEIVSSGTFKIQPGMSVIVNNTVQPDNKLQPTPTDS